MDQERLEFRQWMRANHTRLRAYAPDQIAYLARMNGFSLAVSCERISDHVTQLKRLMEFWENPLSEKWMRVASYERGHDDL